MNEQFTRQAEQFMDAAKAAKIPENIQALAQEGVSRSKEAFDTLSAAAKDQVKVAEELALTTQAGFKSISHKIMDNTVVNTEAAFEAARAIARANTVPEALRLQAEFVQRQFTVASEQTKELFELSTRFATQAFESASEATAKSVEKARKRV
ncbi:MAG: phasin [Alphaproteobacteria bacterium 64-6]|uniref:phasin family protein n=1 Tax=Hyphomicrobium sp. CS1BSMeth3 TaxID=1892844 RepID=UPI0009303C98|nr:phasin family protein [Hyphomicrobium sp. CS1BSMeth3]MBN9261009.1 phasin family protein [Hyphomicrobium sp.]MBN9263637.1 phasin family protein [Hyphomicrobium sp.]OJU23518.1 MAG: phasin [Alphaproteobacteria bacterium 64-6]